MTKMVILASYFCYWNCVVFPHVLLDLLFWKQNGELYSLDDVAVWRHPVGINKRRRHGKFVETERKKNPPDNFPTSNKKVESWELPICI